MNITTKVNVGDKAFILNENRVLEVKVIGCNIRITSPSDFVITYAVGQALSNKELHNLKENEIFNTKEELLKSL